MDRGHIRGRALRMDTYTWYLKTLMYSMDPETQGRGMESIKKWDVVSLS